MTKLTKTAAYQTAEAMAKKAIQPKKEVLKQQRRDILITYALRSVPDFVMKLYVDNAELQPYFNTRNRFRYCFDELHEDYSSYDLKIEIPFPASKSDYLQVSKEDYEMLISISKQIDILDSKERQLKNKIEATLLSLGTLKRIQAEFPEAFAAIPAHYFEKPAPAIIALPIDDLKAELLSYQ